MKTSDSVASVQKGKSCARQKARLHFVQLANVEVPVGEREEVRRLRWIGFGFKFRLNRFVRWARMEELDELLPLLDLEGLVGESVSLGDWEAGLEEGGFRGIMPDWEKQVHLQKEGTAVS